MTPKEELLIIAKSEGNKLVLGAIGSIEKCNAYIEEFRLDGEQGYLTKYFGIKTPYKGWIDTDRIDRVTRTKRVFIELIRAYWFRPKKLMSLLSSIYRIEGGLKDWRLGDNEYCPAVREIIRVGKRYNEDLAYCMGMFLYFSPTYRLWFQEIIGEIDKEYFNKNSLTELLRLKRIFMGRYNSGNPERRKVNLLWWLAIIGLAFKGKLAKEIVNELDISKVIIDDMDWYYCLRRDSYNFRGLLLDERLILVGKRDKEEGNIILGV